MQLALALERGEVTRVALHTPNPDRVAADLIEAGARAEVAVSDREALAGGVRYRWRQGLVIVANTPVHISSEMLPVQRDPYVDAIASAVSAAVIPALAPDDDEPPRFDLGGGG